MEEARSEFNLYQQTLYENLMSLVVNAETKTRQKNKVFYYKNFSYNHAKYRIFSYRLANYSQFCRPSGTECRGHMFQIDKHNQPIRLVSLPLEKFFNINENPSTQNLDFTNPMQIMRKEDGSLISTFTDINGKLKIKSKASILADNGDGWDGLHAVYKFLHENEKLIEELTALDLAGYTINLEYTAPTNQIVLTYRETSLHVLAVRSRSDGSYLSDLSSYPLLESLRVTQVEVPDMEKFLSDYKKEQNIEGYVVQLSTGKFVKLKTEWYFELHHARGSALNSTEQLFKCVINESTDDLKAIITDPNTLGKIQAYEDLASEMLGDMVEGIEEFYEDHKDLTRKKYHQMAGRTLPEWHMAMTMKRLDKELSEDDYKEFMKGQWRKLKKQFESLTW